MLIRFTVSNYLSFKEEAGLNLLATTDSHHQKHVFHAPKGKEVSILRTAVMYGANGSGKSNLVKAIEFAQKLILEGTKSDKPISFVPFKLNADCIKKPGKFEFVIKHNGTLYTYGFLVNSKRVIEEWLYAIINKNEQRLFERITNEQGTVTAEFGPSLARKGTNQYQFLQFVVKGTRPNQLFLTEAQERNVKEIKPLIEWFKNVLTVISPTSVYEGLTIRAHEDVNFAKFIGNFLNDAGTGIEGIEPTEVKLQDKLTEFPVELREKILTDVQTATSVILQNEAGGQYLVKKGKAGEPLLIRLKAKHRMNDGETTTFEFEEESDGTKRLMHLIPALIDSKRREKVYVVDEIDRSLHPLLSKLFLQFYLDEKAFMQGQLILTTHETNLLNLDILRRDEIWFVEKDKKGASHFSSLAEYKVRNDLKIAKGYLQGRFGAIPFIGDLKHLDLQRED